MMNLFGSTFWQSLTRKKCCPARDFPPSTTQTQSFRLDMLQRVLAFAVVHDTSSLSGEVLRISKRVKGLFLCNYYSLHRCSHNDIRYANMDCIFSSVLKHHDTNLHKVVSYDIACQWSVNLPECLAKLPSNIRPPALGSTDIVIPKLHVYSHKLNCKTDYSLNYLWGARHMDGEGIERTHS